MPTSPTRLQRLEASYSSTPVRRRADAKTTREVRQRTSSACAAVYSRSIVVLPTPSPPAGPSVLVSSRLAARPLQLLPPSSRGGEPDRPRDRAQEEGEGEALTDEEEPAGVHWPASSCCCCSHRTARAR
jgi:hypothetical protein